MKLAEKLFVTDLDGTLLDNNGSISAFSAATLNRLLAKGLRITYATARSYHSASVLLHEVNFTLPCITHNGAYLSHAGSGEVIGANFLMDDIARDILLTGDEMGLRPFVCGLDSGGNERILYQEPDNDAQHVFIGQRICICDPRLQSVATPCLPASIIALHYLYPPEILLPLKQYIDERHGRRVSAKFMADIYFPGYYGLEVYHADADKGQMLKELCRRLKVAPADVVVFGDNLNDVEMFEFAGTGVAVANAHADLKAIAAVVTEANAADGVALYLDNWFNNAIAA